MKQLLAQVETEKPLAIGVTGHRTNRLTQADCKILQGRFAALFAQINGMGFPAVTLWTGMAEGTDILAAAARPAGWKMCMVLADTTPNWVARLSGIDAASARVFQQAPTDPEVQTIHVESYSAVGAEITQNADLLIAVWDGAPGSKGGTGEVVRAAKQKALPVLHVPFPLDGTERIL